MSGEVMNPEPRPEEDHEASWWSEMLSDMEGRPQSMERLDLVRNEVLVTTELVCPQAKTVGVQRRFRVEITPILSSSPNAEQFCHLPSTACSAPHLRRHKTAVTSAWGGSFVEMLYLKEYPDLFLF